jgi:hypothetical protein
MQCPYCHNTHLYRNGVFKRQSDAKIIRRFICKNCKKSFSKATIDPCYWQKKRELNSIIEGHLCSAVSQRRSALLLQINRKTVVRKFRFLAMKARLEHQEKLKLIPEVCHLQIDDLITSEHTKCKPLSVSIAIDSQTRFILAAEVSSMPAFGHLAKISRKKYGVRADHRQRGLHRLLQKIAPTLSSNVTVTSDEHHLYPPILKKYCPHAIHRTHAGHRAAIAGQGELKKLTYDPLFMINHTLAMMRANINRLIRKTWCTSKLASALEEHLDLYLNFHNTRLIKQ